MENHQNHKPKPNPEPDLEEKKHHHHHHPQVWGTWEELVLACAVNRHGFKDWDAVAMEVQSRTTLLATATHCEQRFHDLSHRFASSQCDDVISNGSPDHVPWLEQLRSLRVEELRRELQRYDVSILSLQLKVKRLEEERDTENDGKGDEKPDLVVSGEPRPGSTAKTGGEREETEPEGLSEPDIRRLDESTTNTDKLLPTVGDESDRENQSVNESNSTGSRFDGGKTGEGGVKLGFGAGVGPDPVHAGSKEPDSVGRKVRPVGEESNNGSCDTGAHNNKKAHTCESLPPSEERKVVEVDSSELRRGGDSVGQSGEEGGGTRESSEVQSSASLTRKRKTRRRKEVPGGGGGGGEVAPENDEAAVVKSEPLVGVLEMIKRHEHGSLFERRFDKQQESFRYKKLIRQHVDLETIKLRLQKGQYSSCTSSFFRDLLLLFTNATVFFPGDSPESRAAKQLRRLVVAEIKSHSQSQTQSDPITQKTESLPPNPALSKPDSLLSKHKPSTPIVVCRKRSSMAPKPSSVTTFGQKGDPPITNHKKEKPFSDSKPPRKPSSSESDDEEEPPPKAKEKPVTGVRSLRRSNKNLSTNNPGNKKLPSTSTTKSGGSSATKAGAGETLKLEKSKVDGGQEKKRNAAADFLKRIKRNTPAVEGLRSGGGGGGGSSSSSKGGGGGVSSKEQKKMVNSSGKGEKGKEKTSRVNNGGGGGGSGADKRNRNVENSPQSKRSVGRPPKKAAESNAASGKRGRESSASASKDKRPKKRSKK